MSKLKQDRPEGTDALCFTAGLKGIPFSAGVIHAWLAADREDPVVAAGVSAGALTAAALQQALMERKNAKGLPDEEAKRWTWYRRYLAAISFAPFQVIWDAIPNPVDFFADRPPVADHSCPALQAQEAESRDQYYRLVRFGVWLSALRIRISDVANIVVGLVRYKEGYAAPRYQWLVANARFLKVLVLTLVHVVFQPKWAQSGPLFGMLMWGGSTLAVAGFAGLVALYALSAFHFAGRAEAMEKLAGAVLLIGIFVAGMILLIRLSGGAIRYVFAQLKIARGLLHNYHLHRMLYELFGERHVLGRRDGAMDVILVAAPLQRIAELPDQQLWARHDFPLVNALLASLAVPGLFPPVTVTNLSPWLSLKRLRRRHKDISRIDLVDGAAIRQNPMPAFFSWLRGAAHAGESQMAERLRAVSPEDASIHIVYSVPIEMEEAAGEDAGRERITIVQATRAALKLERRRDTTMERRQTNFISQLELHIQDAGGEPAKGLFPILADEIAPPREIQFSNALDPTREEVLRYVAQGCKRTLETLYDQRLRGMAFRDEPVPCWRLLRDVAPNRIQSIRSDKPGVEEVCASCDRQLKPGQPLADVAPGVIRSYSEPTDLRRPAAIFPKLTGEEPRIAFIAAGGVFRGAFHIGVIAALRAAGIRPDLIVGASVGSLMGGALGAVCRLPDPQARDLIAELCTTFERVDQKVALTRSLKNAAKQVGIRGRRVALSPASLRRMIRRGSKTDPGFAATGAPPVLIDAISELFLMPHAVTREIASSFVAGHITSALQQFWNEVERETLPRLDIEYFVMGTSLLEDHARKLLGGENGIDLRRRQPYLPTSAFFATAANLNRSVQMLLGRDALSHSATYDFVQACLGSSAFPAVFAPRSEADVLPGSGSTRVLFADGGIFDNLPFFPAIEVLGHVQEDHATGFDAATSYEYLVKRQQHPTLMIAGSLDSEPAEDEGQAAHLFEIARRAKRLSANVKLRSFVGTAKLVDNQIRRFLQAYENRKGDTPADFANRIVPSSVLAVLPTDDEHLNPTLAFCRSTGLDPARVSGSIADGCFRTLEALAKTALLTDESALQRSIQGLVSAKRVPEVIRFSGRISAKQCPFFQFNRQSFECPFAAAKSSIYEACLRDKAKTAVPDSVSRS